jgi:hypothetical protein
MSTVFATPAGKVRYAGKWRYIVCVRRSNAPIGEQYAMKTLKRSSAANTILAWLESGEGQRMVRDRDVWIVDTCTGEVRNVSQFAHALSKYAEKP